MGIGSFLTEETTEEMSGKKPHTFETIKGAVTMLISYCIAGLLPLAPYTFLKGSAAVNTSIALSLFGLMSLGYGTSLYYKRKSPIRRAIKMLILGGSAIIVGIMIGKLFRV